MTGYHHSHEGLDIWEYFLVFFLTIYQYGVSQPAALDAMLAVIGQKTHRLHLTEKFEISLLGFMFNVSLMNLRNFYQL